MKFTLTFDKTQIDAAKKSTLQKMAKNVNLKGFRPGKAPLELVEQNVSQEKLIEQTASLMLPDAYSNYIVEHKLKPITQPRISLKDITKEGEWVFDVEIAEKPEVKLNKYQTDVKAAKKKSGLWEKAVKKETTKKDAKTDEKAKETEDENNSKKLNLVLETVIKSITIEIPELLIEQEVDHSLSHLVEQVEKLGLKFDQYLSSVGKTLEEIRADYQKSASENLKVEFALDAIAHDQKMTVSEADLDKIFAKADKQTVATIKQNPNELANLKYSLIKQKVVDFLLQL